MDESTEDNRRGVLSAAQQARLRALPTSGASRVARHVQGQTSGTNLAQFVGKAPEGLEADLAEGRVVAADATLGLEPLPGLAQRGWVVRLDDGHTLALAPGVPLPPGRMRIYSLPRSRWVVGGEPRPEQWEEYRSLVLQAQRLDRAQVDALRAGQLPASRRAALRSRVRAWWIPALLWIPVWIGVGASSASVTSEILVFALLLALIGLWASLRIAQVYRDTSQGKVTFVDGPVHINIVIGRQQTNYRLVMGDEPFGLTGSDAGLVPALHEGMPCRLYRTPTTGQFVAIEPLV